MKRVNFCGRRYQNLQGNWGDIYFKTMWAFHELGYEVHVSPTLSFSKGLPSFVKVGIEDSEEDVYVYNHTYLEDLGGFTLGSKTIFLKPTAPTEKHFTLDPIGYACNSSITYERPPYEGYDSTSFFKRDVPEYVKGRANKWKDRPELQFDTDAPEVPDNHVLVIGQMPGDETVQKFSFGDHWAKLQATVHHLILAKEQVVVKLHPTLIRESSADLWKRYQQTIDYWTDNGCVVFTGFESLYDILPKTRVAVVENSTAGLECLMMGVPVISYGFPEYHWATYDLRHVIKLPNLVKDLSWHDKDNANSFVAWYFQQYLCCDKRSAKKRLEQILHL